ncbi:YceD family protein [Sphingomonas sp.]|uniref:YceD family protein n=1 Tax=Sphingomonas sp. TaxID=28214 RepID=UPI003B3A1FFF
MTASEFSRPFRLDTIGDAPRTVAVEAEESERGALAARFGLIALDRLDATAALARDGDVVTATGRIRAEAVQACVASGEPVPAHIDEAFALRFTPPATPAEEEIELDEEELDVLTYEGGAVDLGEAVAQTLALALDPFPRAPGADAALREAGVVSEEETGPFAALKALRDKL